MKSLQGRFLVAAPHQLDPNFVRVVILVVGHTRRAAFGVIVNETAEKRPRLRQRNSRRPSPGKAGFNFGGPVTGPLMAVHTNALLGERRLLPGVFFSAKERNVLSLMGQTGRPCKVFTGYAGWGPGQLDDEVEQGIWRVAPATSEQIFSDSRDLWEQLARQVSRLQLRTIFHIKHIPADPLLN
ncbi:MAG: YqgE/AlgH family protein [Thermoguttaceae bacterium]|jgi:putative transcriptional regulator